MISQVETEKRNLESSLLFMQQEHSTTLKALHEEISKLQKRCRELTFEVTMQNYGTDDDINSKDKIKELEALLKDSEYKQRQLKTEVETKDRNLTDLKGKLKESEKKFLDELKQKNKQVLALKVEVDSKGYTIAHLTTEMHKFKVLQHSTEELSDVPHSPTADETIRRRPRRLLSASDIKSRPVTAKGNMPRPDAEVFLAKAVPIDVQSETVAVKPTPPVLPPITGGDEISRKVFSRRQQLARRRMDVKSQPEYGKLAVDKLASSGNTWVHDPNAATKQDS